MLKVREAPSSDPTNHMGKLSKALASHTARQQSKAKEAVAEASHAARIASIGKGKGKAERKVMAEKKQKKLDVAQAVGAIPTSNPDKIVGNSGLNKYRSKGNPKGKQKQVVAEQEQGIELGEEEGEKGQDEAQAEEIAQINRLKSKLKAKQIQPFQPEDTILLIGEGNFSFTLSLISPPTSTSTYSHSTSQILSTAYDSEAECYSKYPDAKGNVEKIRSIAGRDDVVVFGVDAGQLNKCRNVTGRKKGEKENRSKERRWSKVWFGFPHNGE